MRETLSVLASHPAAQSSYRICLGCEDREVGAGDKALRLMREFDGSFYDMQFTLHPGDLAGEAAGKSSNVSWAARTMYLQGLAGNVITVCVPAGASFHASSHVRTNSVSLVNV